MQVGWERKLHLPVFWIIRQRNVWMRFSRDSELISSFKKVYPPCYFFQIYSSTEAYSFPSGINCSPVADGFCMKFSCCLQWVRHSDWEWAPKRRGAAASRGEIITISDVTQLDLWLRGAGGSSCLGCCKSGNLLSKPGALHCHSQCPSPLRRLLQRTQEPEAFSFNYKHHLSFLGCWLH